MRRLSLLGVGLILALLLGAQSSTPTHAADAPTSVWPTENTMQRANPLHNSAWGTALDSDIAWTFDTMGEDLDTEAVVVDGIVYIGTRTQKIFAMDAVTGNHLWTFYANNWIMTNPIVKDGILFAGSGNRDRQPVPRSRYSGTGLSSIYAINAKTGELIWEYKVNGHQMPTPVYKDGVVYFVGGDRVMRGFEAKTGKIVAERLVDSIIAMSSPALDGTMLYFGGNLSQTVYGYDVSQNKIVWATDPPDVQMGIGDCPPAVYNGTVYINGNVPVKYLDDGSLIVQQFMLAFDAKTGALKWRFSEGQGVDVDDNQAGVPVVENGVVYQTSPSAKTLSAVNAATGQGLWQVGTGALSKGAPVVYGNYVIIATGKGELISYNKQTGALITKKTLVGKVGPQGPTLFNGTLYVGTQNGFVYAIPAATLMKADAPTQAKTGREFYPQTGHSLGGVFRDYWQAHGGLAQFGYPTTEEFPQFDKASGKTYTVQYFERNRFEYHPDAPADYQILLGLLGNDLTAMRRTLGEMPFMRVPDPLQLSTNWYSQTGHTLNSDFLAYWQAHGDLATYGYPISQPFEEKNPDDGKTYTVQYFERARFELHPEAPEEYRVLLGLLGKTQMSQHWTIPTLTPHPTTEPPMNH